MYRATFCCNFWKTSIERQVQITHPLHPDIFQSARNICPSGPSLRAVLLAKIVLHPPIVLADVHVIVPDDIIVLLCVCAVQKSPQGLVSACPLIARLPVTELLQAPQSSCTTEPLLVIRFTAM